MPSLTSFNVDADYTVYLFPKKNRQIDFQFYASRKFGVLELLFGRLKTNR
jgi:hypothetical protein